MAGMRCITVWAILVGGALADAPAAQVGPSRARIVTAQEWAGRGEWVRGDLHMHTKSSDGESSIEEVAAQAEQHGCEAIAITDHADRTLRGASPEYIAAIQQLRVAKPDLIVLAGLEWNIPPRGGDEHLTVLVPPDSPEGEILAEFKRRFDDFERQGDPAPPAADALAWLADATRQSAVKPVVVYNHPSRKDETSLANVDDILKWRATNDLVIGFESGPGHQGKPPLGAYGGKEPVIDRWDPVAARPGDAWDTLLQRGVDVHGAMAASDFHNANPASLNDFWPCQFAETWYYVPERTALGVLRALRAGTFFGAHGHIAREVGLTLNAAGLMRPAISGERVEAPPGTEVTAALAMTIPELDWEGRPNQVDRVEFIVITPSEVTVHAYDVTGTGPRTVSHTLTIGTGGAVIRARGRRVVPDGPDLMFYTNAIRVSAAP